MSTIGIKELALLIVVVLVVLELRRAHRFARDVQTRIADSTVSAAARVRRFSWIIGGGENVAVYAVAAVTAIAFALLTTAYFVIGAS